MERKLITLLILCILSFSCSSGLKEQKQFLLSKQESLLKDSIPLVQVKLHLPLASLSGLINKRLESRLYSDETITIMDGVSASVTLDRTGAIEMVGENGQLATRIPLRFWAHLNESGELPFTGTLSAEAVVSLATRLRMVDDSGLVATTHCTGILWKSRPIIRLGPLSLPLTADQEKMAVNILDRFAPQFDRKIGGEIGLQRRLDLLAQQFAEPKKIVEEPDLFLVNNPERIAFGQPIISLESLEIQGVVEGALLLADGELPQPLSPQAIHMVALSKERAPGFIYEATADIGYQTAGVLILKSIRDTLAHRLPGVKLDSLVIRGENFRLRATAALSGSVVGEIVVEGTPMVVEGKLGLEGVKSRFIAKNFISSMKYFFMTLGMDGTIAGAFNRLLSGDALLQTGLKTGYVMDCGEGMTGKISSAQIVVRTVTVGEHSLVVRSAIGADLLIGFKE